LRQLDLIYCQNVLIYFARERRGELLDGLARLLRPNGLLVLGAGEVSNWNTRSWSAPVVARPWRSCAIRNESPA
jgi:chemotaxis methyl-accepting protein methylase